MTDTPSANDAAAAPVRERAAHDARQRPPGDRGDHLAPADGVEEDAQRLIAVLDACQRVAKAPRARRVKGSGGAKTMVETVGCRRIALL